MIERLSPTAIRLIAIGAILFIFGAPVVVLLWLTAVPGISYAGPLPPLTSAEAQAARRLRSHIVAIASIPHNTRFPAALERSARAIERELVGLGYVVRRQSFTADGRWVRNLDVTIDPARPGAPALVIGAHYDSAFDAPGANDNGSGTAAVLELARNLRDLRGKAAMRIRLALFVNEEPPYFQNPGMGSMVYAQHLVASGEKVAAMFSLETLGCYSDQPGSQRYPVPLNLLYPDTGNFVAFVGMTGSRTLVRKSVALFRAHAQFPSQGGSAPGWVSGIDWSDHWSFAQVGVPAEWSRIRRRSATIITTRRRIRRTEWITNGSRAWCPDWS